MIGHKMWTPSDIEQYTPAPNERPYAGFLHSEFNYISLHPQQAQRFNLTIGTTGDSALSEQAQKSFTASLSLAILTAGITK
ncbi:exonuclease [Vibrio metschnikovii]|nr:exonuclease [Vibrio metschnikovii]